VLAGVAFSLFAAVAYASYGVPMKRALQVTTYWEFTPWMALGICITATALLLTRRQGISTLRAYPIRDRAVALLGGVSWTLAFYALAASMQLVDFAVAWTLSNLNTVPAVFLGIVAFREVDWRTHRARILLGLGAATLGTVFLALAKSHPVP
jgi:glucose uptake protein GlcU